jgi:23S rRNA pseudouridine2457 synthase
MPNIALMASPHRYFMIHKPYGMESQFKLNHPSFLLGDLQFSFPEGIHAVGRLDKPSEGLLLLTTNKKITKLLFESSVPHKRTYLVQVKGIVSDERLQELQTGVRIRISGDHYYTTPPCGVTIAEPPDFPSPKFLSPRVKTTWLNITLTEGKYRQVRKMVAAIRHGCIRLIRTSIEGLELGSLQAGEVQELGEDVFFEKLNLDLSQKPGAL